MSPAPASGDKGHNETNSNKKKKGMNLVKSPSDTTMYAPALNMINRRTELNAVRQNIVETNTEVVGNDGNHGNSFEKGNEKVVGSKRDKTVDTDIMMKISNFVDQIRLE